MGERPHLDAKAIPGVMAMPTFTIHKPLMTCRHGEDAYRAGSKSGMNQRSADKFEVYDGS
jgi:hypothetical protein